MDSNLDDIKARIRALPDDELIKMLDDSEQVPFLPEALLAAEEEVEARGGLAAMRNQSGSSGNDDNTDDLDENAEVEDNYDAGSRYDEHELPRAALGWWGSSKVLKEETILNEWSSMIFGAADHGMEVLKAIHRRLFDARIPGGCTWGLAEVRSTGLISRVKREFLVVELDQFQDYHMYIGARPYGNQLDCCRFLTVEPGRLKGYIATKLKGSADALSAPRNILVHQDLRAWATVVHHAVLDSVQELYKSLGQDTKHLRRESRGILEIW